MSSRFIALDWGTTSFRAYVAEADGTVINTVEAPEGILAVSNGDFEIALERHIGKWDKKLPVLAAGMIASRQGWIEVPYVSCPAGLPELAKALHHHRSKNNRDIYFSTGLSWRSPDGMPDVMRGEETKVLGSVGTGAKHYVTPGTHSKWITVEGGRIAHFTTYVTGEVFAALKSHTILGRLMKDAPHEEAAFARGVRAALADPAGFLHRIFSARSLGLFGEMPPEHLSSYLSGQVIGTEVAHAMSHHGRNAEYIVLASAGLEKLYAGAMKIAGLKVRGGDTAAVVKGLAAIARHARILKD